MRILSWLFVLLAAMLLVVSLEHPPTEDPVDQFYEQYQPHTIYVGEIRGQRMFISNASGDAANDVLGVERPFSKQANAVISRMLIPVPHCSVVEAKHLADDFYRSITVEHNVKVLQLCPTSKNQVITGFVGIYLVEGDERDLLAPLGELAKELNDK